jgi:hypothetical protein
MNFAERATLSSLKANLGIDLSSAVKVPQVVQEAVDQDRAQAEGEESE